MKLGLGYSMYKRTKYKIPFYPAYTNAYNYYRANVEPPIPGVLYGDAVLIRFEEWILAQGAHFHRRSPSAKQNHNIFFDTDEQRVMFLLKVSG